MNILTPYSKRLAGFSLVEMAIVILIAGIMMGAGLSLLAVKQTAAQADVTRKNQETIKQALINYLGQKKRLPCPTTVANGGIAAPLPPCTSYSGIVPYYALGLDRAVALDGWENFITYVVSANPITTPPLSPYTTAWLYSYNASSSASPNTNNASLAFWPSISTGGITVTDGTNTIASPSNATGAAVVLISYGKNGYGAFNIKGQNAPPPTANVDEVKNAAPDSTGLAITVVKRDASEIFDDILMIVSTNDLTGPLITNGTLQSNAQAALTQANDVVLSNIVGSRACIPAAPACSASPRYQYSIPGNPSSPPTPYFTFPPAVSAWGVTYATTAAAATIGATTPASGNAYTLTAGDGTTKMVSIDELRGILLRGAGFN